MGSWGIKALESDNGLDVRDCLNDYLTKLFCEWNRKDKELYKKRLPVIMKTGSLFQYL